MHHLLGESQTGLCTMN